MERVTVGQRVWIVEGWQRNMPAVVVSVRQLLWPPIVLVDLRTDRGDATELASNLKPRADE